MDGNSSSSQSGQSVFSLESQTGVMQLLAAIRASDITSAEKNELRDLVFLYTNGGHDETVKISLEQKVTAHNLVPLPGTTVAKKESETSVKKRPAIGNFRAAPSFAVSQSEDDVPEEVPENSSTPTPEPTPSPVPTPEVKTAPEPDPVPTPAPVQPVDTPASTPAPVTVAADDGSALERIKEIKALVNQKVGNPVHLVDLNPEIGREYMSALLEAMKKVSSGSSAGQAMSRLETAYNVIEKMDTASASAEVSTAPVADVSGATNRAAELLQDDEDPVTPEPPIAPSTPTPPVAPPKQVAPVVDVPEYQPPVAPVTQVTPPTRVAVQGQKESIKSPTAVPINTTKRSSFATDGHDESAATTPVMPVGESMAPPPAPMSPSASLSKPLKGQEASLDSSDPDGLKSPEIDRGLAQLLEEWPIFMKSGLFGTGPKGREHPLFKKVAGLQIPLLLAGRFEGATQEIKQSITDYMNGWRYEQGVIYQPGETFEHYLRRVIKHILDLQKMRM